MARLPPRNRHASRAIGPSPDRPPAALRGPTTHESEPSVARGPSHLKVSRLRPTVPFGFRPGAGLFGLRLFTSTRRGPSRSPCESLHTVTTPCPTVRWCQESRSGRRTAQGASCRPTKTTLKDPGSAVNASVDRARTWSHVSRDLRRLRPSREHARSSHTIHKRCG